jgi:hypothetical protein
MGSLAFDAYIFLYGTRKAIRDLITNIAFKSNGYGTMWTGVRLGSRFRLFSIGCSYEVEESESSRTGRDHLWKC